MNKASGANTVCRADVIRGAADRIGLLTEAGLARLGSSTSDLTRLCRHTDNVSGTVYYTTRRAPLDEKRYRRAYATEHAIFRPDAARRLIPERDLREVIGHMPHLLALWRSNVPVCVIDQTEEKARLLIVRAGTATSAQAAVRELDQYVASDAFRPLWHFLDAQDNGLLYLYAGSATGVPELQRWLDHRPPLATCGRPAIEIPVVVEAAAAPGATTRSLTRRGAR